MTTMDELREPKRRKRRHRMKLKKLNPFRKKYKKFSEDDVTNGTDIENDIKKIKKRSRVGQFFYSAVGVVTFRSLRKRRRHRANSAPLSSRMKSRTKYSSTGSLDCLVTRDDNEELETVKGLKRSQSDSCLYQTSKGLKKKKSKAKRVKKVSNLEIRMHTTSENWFYAGTMPYENC